MAKSPDPGGFQPIEVPARDQTALPGFRPIEVDRSPRPAPVAEPARKPQAKARRSGSAPRRPAPQPAEPAPTPDTAAAENQEA